MAIDGTIGITYAYHDTESQAAYAWFCGIQVALLAAVRHSLAISTNSVSVDQNTRPLQITGGNSAMDPLEFANIVAAIMISVCCRVSANCGEERTHPTQEEGRTGPKLKSKQSAPAQYRLRTRSRPTESVLEVKENRVAPRFSLAASFDEVRDVDTENVCYLLGSSVCHVLAHCQLFRSENIQG